MNPDADHYPSPAVITETYRSSEGLGDCSKVLLQNLNN